MVLGINNRTENWKTARSLAPLFDDGASRLAHRLGEPVGTRDVNLELYWQGLRDHIHQAKDEQASSASALADIYRRLFPDLREKVKTHPGLRLPHAHNYQVTNGNQEQQLKNNLRNTEVDIVLESPTRLYIGEAKFESTFGANGQLVLPHQLLRQYVMAKILLDLIGCEKDVVPFVVTKQATRAEQVKFMICQCWMERSNLLTWKHIKEVASEA